MASSVHTGVPTQTLSPVSKSKPIIKPFKQLSLPATLPPPQQWSLDLKLSVPMRRRFATRSMAREFDVFPVQSEDCTGQQGGSMVMAIDREGDSHLQLVGVSGGVDALDLGGGSGGGGGGSQKDEEEDLEKLMDRAINATIVLAAGSFAITKLLTIDHDYWHGWTVFEILRYAPQHTWDAYEEALKTNPVLAKMMISGIVYSLGDWIAQCVEGKPLFDFDRARMFRSGLVGFTLHGSLSHYYYEFSEFLFPYKGWWVVPAKVAFDQTLWSALWNSIYYTAVGLLRLDSPMSIFTELRTTFWPMLTAGWKLWPFAHLITYGVVPLEQRLLWVDSVELIWVTILSTFSNEKSEARMADASEQDLLSSTTDVPSGDDS